MQKKKAQTQFPFLLYVISPINSNKVKNQILADILFVLQKMMPSISTSNNNECIIYWSNFTLKLRSLIYEWQRMQS